MARRPLAFPDVKGQAVRSLGPCRSSPSSPNPRVLASAMWVKKRRDEEKTNEKGHDAKLKQWLAKVLEEITSAELPKNVRKHAIWAAICATKRKGPEVEDSQPVESQKPVAGGGPCHEDEQSFMMRLVVDEKKTRMQVKEVKATVRERMEKSC